MASQRSGGYTTSGRSSGGKSSAKPVAKKASPKPAAKKSAPPKKASSKPAGKSKFPDKMTPPGMHGGRSMFVVDSERTTGVPRTPKTGRDRFGPSKKGVAARGRSGPGANRQEGEAKIMSAMFRDRLGPGQR